MNTVNNAKNVNTNAMTVKPVRRNNSMAGVSLLITLTSVVATLTGWAVFANKDFTAASATNTAVVAPASTTTIAQALPTIEPLVSTGTTSQIVQVAQVTQATATKTTVQQATTVARTAPRTVTTTRSSR